MKFKCFILSTVAVTIAMGMCSCSKDKDEPEVAVAEQVVGSYTGNEIMTVMGDPDESTKTFVFTKASQVAGSYTGQEIIMVDNDESSNETKIYEFAKASDTSIDMTVPEAGMGGMMTIPSFSVKNIMLTKSGNSIIGRLATYDGTVTNAKGEEKAFNVKDITVMFSDNSVVVTFTLKYGNMPFALVTNFTGTK